MTRSDRKLTVSAGTVCHVKKNAMDNTPCYASRLLAAYTYRLSVQEIAYHDLVESLKVPRTVHY
jgi:hypothetical protein